jgi:hypothetical protein
MQPRLRHIDNGTVLPFMHALANSLEHGSEVGEFFEWNEVGGSCLANPKLHLRRGIAQNG